MWTIHGLLIPSLWAAWLIYWCAAAFAAKPVRRRESIASRLSHTIPLAVGVALLASSRLAGPLLATRLLPWSPARFWIGAALVTAGLGFAAAARTHLGGNWSGTVTLKQDHTLTRSGPYRWVRHPIYTGLLVAVLGTAVAQGEARGLIALLLIVAAILRRIRIEERFMLAHFGDDYAVYRRRVAALVPGWR